ncbi:alpha-(1,3)-fucosyltransferase 10-like [Artemia franciscana]|uniref:alpha-(1,3)-fucosyltransferase 10-like n=1 Tax=Artemia franciscana TaxID=6661 RepID=UPI0032DA9FF7
MFTKQILRFVFLWFNYSYAFGHRILWWTPFVNSEDFPINCGSRTCLISDNRSESDQASVITFYGTDFKPYDVPIPRKNQVWAILHEESPKNNPILCNPAIAEFFNYSATYSQFSDIPLTLVHLKSIEQIIDLTYFKSTQEKSIVAKKEGLASIIYVQSACDAPSQRDIYVKELMKFISIDSYGKCLNNKPLPTSLRNPTGSMEEPQFLDLISKYKFAIAFENAVTDDYITEKLWRPIRLGTVPIYLGAPNIKKWLPHENAAIVVTDFDSPKSLANYLHALNLDDEAYNQHLQHKMDQRVQNEKLLDAFKAKSWRDENGESFIDSFHCYLCEEAHKIDDLRQLDRHYSHHSDLRVFSCPLPTDPLTGIVNPSVWWTEYFVDSFLEGDVAQSFLKKNQNFSHDEFSNEVIRHLSHNPTIDEL